MPYSKTNSARLSKLVLRVREIFFFNKKSFFLKFFILLVLWAKGSEPFVGKNLEVSSKQLFKRREQYSERNTIHKVLVFAYLPRKKWPKVLRPTLQNCFCLVHRNILRKFVSLKFFFHSDTKNITILPYGKTNSARL